MLTRGLDDPNTPDTVNVSGMMKYLGDIGVDIEDIGMLAVSEIVKSPTMGEMTKDGFVEGWSALGYVFLPYIVCLHADWLVQLRHSR